MNQSCALARCIWCGERLATTLALGRLAEFPAPPAQERRVCRGLSWFADEMLSWCHQTAPLVLEQLVSLSRQQSQPTPTGAAAPRDSSRTR